MLHRPLFVVAFLAAVFDARLARRRVHFIDRAAFAALRLDPGVALLDRNGLFRHRFADQTFRLFAHFLFRHVQPLLTIRWRTLSSKAGDLSRGWAGGVKENWGKCARLRAARFDGQPPRSEGWLANRSGQ